MTSRHLNLKKGTEHAPYMASTRNTKECIWYKILLTVASNSLPKIHAGPVWYQRGGGGIPMATRGCYYIDRVIN